MILKYLYSFLIIIGLVYASCSDKRQMEHRQEATHKEQAVGQAPSVKGNAESDNSLPPDVNQANNIPPKVYKVLKYILENGAPMDGYVGGRDFQNRERILPTKDKTGNRIKYQEWDVNPKRYGQNRGTQRLITGSDGRAWYTDDHYKSFTEITITKK